MLFAIPFHTHLNACPEYLTVHGLDMHVYEVTYDCVKPVHQVRMCCAALSVSLALRYICCRRLRYVTWQSSRPARQMLA